MEETKLGIWDLVVLEGSCCAGAVEKDMLLILDIISITQVIGGGIVLFPCRCLKM
jgi:hypothetical protein